MRRNQPDRDGEPERNQDQVVAIAEHRHEVRNQVDRAEGIGDHACHE
jgi:hypothetical protein